MPESLTLICPASVTLPLTTMFVGKGQTSYGSGTATGTLTLTDGTLDANTIEVGYQSSSSATAVVSGTVNVNGTATLVVHSMLRLASNVGGSNAPVGTLNISGGTVMSGDDSGSGIIAGGGTSTIAINGGEMAMTGAIGAIGAAIGKVAMTNATLVFSVTGGTANLVATNLVTGTGTNTIVVISLPAIGPVITQVSLIQYAGAIGGSGYNFVLGSLVPSGGYSGYLSNNVANSSVDLVFVGLPAAPLIFGAVKVSGMNVIFTGTNGVPNWTYYVLTSTNLALPLTYWTMMATNVFDSGGGFQFTNTHNALQQFYRLQLP